jgi:hypothetical protein
MRTELETRVFETAQAIDAVLTFVPELRNSEAHQAIGPALFVITLATATGLLTDEMVTQFEDEAALFVLLGIFQTMDA